MAAASKKKLHTVTIQLLGDSGVGKTLMSKCIAEGGPLEKYQVSVTISPDFVKVDYDMKGVGEFRVLYIDPPGTIMSRDMVTSYFRGAHAFLGVFDVTNNKTYASLRDDWLPAAAKHRGMDDVPVLIVGNKTDLMVVEAQLTKVLERAHADFTSPSFPEGLEYIETIGASARNWIFPDVPSRFDCFVAMVVKRSLERQRTSDKRDAESKGIRLLDLDTDPDKKSNAASDDCGTC